MFASNELPVTVVATENAEVIYNNLLGSNLFRVPCGGNERLSKWPQLMFKDFEICGKIRNEASADIVLSSAGNLKFSFSQRSGIHDNKILNRSYNF